MDRHLSQDFASFHPGEVAINCQFTAGASGAVPALSAFTRRAGIAGVTLSPTGLYMFTFEDASVSVLDVHAEVLQVTYAAAHGGQATRTPTDTINTATPTVTLQVRSCDGLGTAVALTSGDVFNVRFIVARMRGNG